MDFYVLDDRCILHNMITTCFQSLSIMLKIPSVKKTFLHEQYLNQTGCKTARSLWLSALTNAVQDPAHCPIPTAGQHTEIRNITEEVEPRKRNIASVCDTGGLRGYFYLCLTVAVLPTDLYLKVSEAAVFNHGPWCFCNDFHFGYMGIDTGKYKGS